MALSNYVHLVWDEQGKQLNGLYDFDMGILVEVYKDWLYLHDYEVWNQNMSHFAPFVVKEIREGDFCYKQLFFLVKRLSYRKTLLFGVWREKEQDGMRLIKGMAGIASYAYEDEQYSGIDQRQWEGFVLEMKELPFCFQQQFLPLSLTRNQGDLFFLETLGLEEL